MFGLRAGTHLSRGILLRARLGAGGTRWTRSYSASAFRAQQQQPLPSTTPKEGGVQSHITDSSGRGVAFEDVAGSVVVRPGFASSIKIELHRGPAIFDSIFLRDSCKCPLCVDPSSSQKSFQTADIPANIEGSCQVTDTLEEANLAVVKWRNDIPGFPEGHQTALSLEFLERTLRDESRHQAREYDPPTRVLWDKKTMHRDNVYVDYNRYLDSDEVLYQTLQTLHTHGLVFISNVPDTIDTDSSLSVTTIAERIGSMRDTFYGRTWDVKSVPNAKNVAYTHQYLGLHMDLCYMDNTPHLQFLHCMRARSPGGESLFADSIHAAEMVRQRAPELFDALRTFGVTYHYFNAGQAYRQVRPTVELENQDDATSPIKLLNWSPPFQGPFAHDIGTRDGGKALRRYHAAAQMLDSIISAPENLFELRMEEGVCVIFDNRRVLHARRAFDASKGERWLKGAYMDRDVYASKLAVLGMTFEQRQ